MDGYQRLATRFLDQPAVGALQGRLSGPTGTVSELDGLAEEEGDLPQVDLDPVRLQSG